jgi:hypothetical protein
MSAVSIINLIDLLNLSLGGERISMVRFICAAL